MSIALALVGHTGFVGSNIAACHGFDGLYNSQNIKKAYGTCPDLLIYAGVPAAKFLADKDPDGDMAVCQNAFENIKKIAPKKLVLISTVDIYQNPNGADENTPADAQNPSAYGRNRAALEKLVRAEYNDALIIRLPALFGTGLKKNFIYDFLHPAPSMLTQQKYDELSAKSELISQCYAAAQNGFYKLENESVELVEYFQQSDFNSLCFTDSRAEYQLYDVSCLWRDISVALAANLTLLNITAEPLCAAAIYDALTYGGKFENILQKVPAKYDMKSKYAPLYGGENGYIYSADETLEALKAFVNAARREDVK